MRAAVAASLLVAGLVGCGKEPPPPEAPFDPFISMEDAEPFATSPIDGAPEGWTVARGLVEPTSTSRISFEVPGMVSEVFVEEGDVVRRGQTLGRLATEEREAKLATARELYRSARAAAPHAAEGDGPPPPSLEAAVRRRLERVSEAAKKAPGDRAAVQRAAKRAGEEAAEEAARDLAIRIGTYRNKGGEAGRRARSKASDDALALAVASELRTRVRNLEDAVNKSRVASPLDGLVIRVNARPGEPWNTRVPEAAFEVVDPTSYVARVSLPASRALRFAENEEAWVELPGHVRSPDRLLPAVVSTISSVDVPMEDDDGITTLWREVAFKLPSRLPEDLIIGDEVRVAFAP